MRLSRLIALLFLPLPAFAACHAVGPTATGSGTGADWNNQMTLPAAGSYVRGDIYYLADGDYSTHTNFTTSDSSTSVIELRKAQTYDNGSSCSPSIAAGWNTSTMGSSQASWTWASAGSMISITTDYWKFNGNGANVGTANIGCGGVFSNQPTWSTETFPNSQRTGPTTPSDCGILINAETCTGSPGNVTSNNGCDSGNGEIHSTGGNITWDSVEWALAGLNSNSNNNSETYGWLAQGSPSNITLTHCYCHNAATTYITAGSGGFTNGVVDYNYLWSVFDGALNHGEAIQGTGTDSGTVIHHNIYRDMHTNGWFAVFVDPVTGTHSNWSIYSNLAVCSSGNSCRSSDGIFACINSSQTCTGFNIVQNTMIGDFTNNAGIVCTNACTGNLQDNLWYLSGSALSGISITAMTQDHNSFLLTTGSAGTGNVNCASSCTNPFVNWTAGNFALASDNADWNGRTATAIDPLTDIFNATFTTDRGASQFVSTAIPGGDMPPGNEIKGSQMSRIDNLRTNMIGRK